MIDKNVRTLLFKIQNNHVAQINLTIEISADSTEWLLTDKIVIGANDSFIFNTPDIPAGMFIRIKVLSKDTSAVAYIDDLKVIVPKETDDINTLAVDKVKKTEGAWYTLSGQRVAQPTKKGIYICNGTKVMVQ